MPDLVGHEISKFDSCVLSELMRLLDRNIHSSLATSLKQTTGILINWLNRGATSVEHRAEPLRYPLNHNQPTVY
jgi:hypothetical protein